MMVYLLLSVILTAAVFYDKREGKIPNGLCLGAAIVGLLWGLWWYGMGETAWRILGAALLFVLFLPFWRLRMVGAGDVKLIMTACLYLGRGMIPFLCTSGVCTAGICLFLLAKRGNLRERISLFTAYVGKCFSERCLMPYPFDRETDGEAGGIKVSYGLLAGHMVAMSFGLY